MRLMLFVFIFLMCASNTYANQNKYKNFLLKLENLDSLAKKTPNIDSSIQYYEEYLQIAKNINDDHHYFRELS